MVDIVVESGFEDWSWLNCVGDVQRGDESRRAPEAFLYTCLRRRLGLPRILTRIRRAQSQVRVTCREGGVRG